MTTTMKNVVSEPLTKFHPFRQLPAELRLKIWNLKYKMDEVNERDRLVKITYDERNDCIISLSRAPVLLHVNQETRGEFISYYDVFPNIPTAYPPPASIYVQDDTDLVYVERKDEFGILKRGPALVDLIYARMLFDKELQCVPLEYYILDDVPTMRNGPSIGSQQSRTTPSSASLSLPQPKNRQQDMIVDQEHDRATRLKSFDLASRSLSIKTMRHEESNPRLWTQMSRNVYEMSHMYKVLEEDPNTILQTTNTGRSFEAEIYARDGWNVPSPPKYAEYPEMQRGSFENHSRGMKDGMKMENLGEYQRLRLPDVKEIHGRVDKWKWRYLAYEGEKYIQDR